ncbi:MAG: recombination protein O N-terminal domain-containing protein [Sphingomicrobium sp.]
MRFTAPAIFCALRTHGEHGAVVRMLTREHGLQAAYVRGARGRRMRPVLIAGNLVEAQYSARSDVQLPQATVELVHSRAPLFSEPLPTAAIEWATVLTATVLPEAQPYPMLYDALGGLLDAIEAAPAASGWGAALVRYELLLLAELGFGIDFESSSEKAVLPPFLGDGGEASWGEIGAGLALTGRSLERDLLTGRAEIIGGARDRLVERLRRAGGL